MNDAPEITLSNLAPSKLLHYVKKQDLINLITPPTYVNLETQLFRETGVKPTLKDIKSYLATQSDFIANLRQNEVGINAFASYLEARGRLTAIDRSRLVEIRRGMSLPRRQYIGCLATKLKPEDYTDCLGNYDNGSFDNIKIIPAALKNRVYDNTQNLALKTALAPTVSRGMLSSIPQGLKSYIASNPLEFKQYNS